MPLKFRYLTKSNIFFYIYSKIFAIKDCFNALFETAFVFLGPFECFYLLQLNIVSNLEMQLYFFNLKSEFDYKYIHIY